MNDKLYIVWVGGVADYEGYNHREAVLTARSWQTKGYDDVYIQIVKKVIA
jgi:hypothetical protein